MRGAIGVLLAAACSAAVQPPRAPSCADAVCGREQLTDADRALQRAIGERGMASAFSDVLLDDAQLLSNGKGLSQGKPRVLEVLLPMEPFTWTLAGADVSSEAALGYTYGWMEKGHYAAVWRHNGGAWKLAVFLRSPAQPDEVRAVPAGYTPATDRGRSAPRAKQSISAADTAFAARAKSADLQTAFTEYAAPDAVLFGPTILFGRDAIHAALANAPAIDWGPTAEGSEQDLGYTIGAFARGNAKGHYLTVWRLEPDGSWRYVLDGGVRG